MFSAVFTAILKGRSRSSRRRPAKLPPGFRPQLVRLEDRALPSTFTVLNRNDSGPGSLRAALAPGDDTITFARGLHGTITLTGGELLITSNVTISGPGANKLAVSGNDAGRVFEIASGLNVTISGLTVTHEYAPDQGGGILNDGSNLTLTGDDLTQNVAFESGTSGGRGGGLRSLDGSLTITDCQITDNQALGGAGASAFGDAFGGGLYIAAGSATISNSTISGNLAIGADGATGEFVGEGSGGAIFELGTLTISGSAFDHNQAVGGNGDNSGAGAVGPFIDYGFGGASDATSSTVHITDSSFSHNQAVGGNDGTGTGTDIIGVGGAEGGAIYNEVGGVVILSGSTLDHNQAVGGNGNTGTAWPAVLVGEGLGGGIVSRLRRGPRRGQTRSPSATAS